MAAETPTIEDLTQRYQARAAAGRVGELPDQQTTADILRDRTNSTDRRHALAVAIINGLTMEELADLPVTLQQPIVEETKDDGYEPGGPRDTILRAVAHDPKALLADTAALTHFVGNVGRDPELQAAREKWHDLEPEARWTALQKVAKYHAQAFDYPLPRLQAYRKPRQPFDSQRFIYEFGEFQGPVMGGGADGILRFNIDPDHTSSFEQSFEHMTHELTHGYDVSQQQRFRRGELPPKTPRARQIARMQTDFADGIPHRAQRRMAGRIPYEYQATEQRAVLSAKAAVASLKDPNVRVGMILASALRRHDDMAAPAEPVIKKLPEGVEIPRGHLAVTVEKTNLEKWRDKRAPASAPQPSFGPG
ncbi:MAG: hypothetical protein KI792_12270 [Alphaproteobacteria bacterium]|nr:hypothetical protein [Alphaproteobacteria bacterium SS10]